MKYKFIENFDFIEKIKRRSIINKKEEESPYDHLACASQRNCIQQCMNAEFAKEYKNISAYSTIDKDHFTRFQWNNSFPVYQETNEFKKICENKFPLKDYYEAYFVENDQVGELDSNNLTVKLNLYYDVYESYEYDTSSYKLVIDVLNIVSILFGQNAFRLLLILNLLIGTKFKLKANKFHLLPIYMLCSIGLAYHIYYIWDEIIDGELILNAHYDVINPIEIPELVFCFNYDRTAIDRNYLLTGSYLKAISKDITKRTIFKTISYLTNRTDVWTTLESNLTDSNLKIATFFLLDKKCFKIVQNLTYDTKQLLYEDTNRVLSIHLNRSIVHQANSTVLSFTKFQNLMKFSRAEELRFENGTHAKAFSLYQRILELTYKDKFNWIKQPLVS